MGPGSGHRVLPVAAAAAMVLLVFAASARADQTMVDFETGPPLNTAVTDEYKASAFVQFLAADPGFRPYRKTAPAGTARSGTVVADVGPDVCPLEGFGGNSCEIYSGGIFTYGRFTRTATAVTLYAGLFSGTPTQARLLAYDSSGQQLATGSWVSVSAAGFTTPVTVSAAGMAAFALETADAAAIGFDDLTMTFPANSLPDVSVSAPADVIPVLSGQSKDVPITVTRLNGSSGDLHFTFGGLPAGVSAQVIPDPLTGTTENATLRLTAAADAPEVVNPATITVTADPQGNASVAPGPRSATLAVRVASPYALAVPAAVQLPDCASVDVPLTVKRDYSFTGTIDLSLDGVPAGVSATILPSPNVPPYGDVYQQRTLHLTRGPTGSFPVTITVRGTSAGLADRTAPLQLQRAISTATARSGLGFTPRHRGPGTTITLDGTGFCPGTTVQVGNTLATAPTTVADDGRSLTFTVPRLATSGPVTVVPPGSPYTYFTAPLTVKGFRDTAGFPFHNPSYGSLSIDELTDAFGASDLFIKVNPCWPWGDCTVVTGILNPIAAVDWGVMDLMAHESGGHCFGISRAVEQLLLHKVPYARFAAVSSAFALPSASGPSAGLMSYLDGQHATQFSDEFIGAWLDGRNAAVADQLQTLLDELAAGRDPLVTIAGPSFGEGHALIAYDAEPTADGWDVFVYDSNRQYDPSGEANATTHKQVEAVDSVIHFKVGGIITSDDSWSFVMAGGNTWSGSNDSALTSDGNLFVAPQSTVPDDPSLPGLGTLAHAIGFGSPDGAVTTVPSGSKDQQFLPALDANGKPGAAGTWVSRGDTPVSASFHADDKGTYSASYTGRGFAASVVDVPAAPGVTDATSGAGDALTFTSGMGRPLTFALANDPGAAHGRRAAAATAGGAAAWSATVTTHAGAKSSDRAGLSDGGTVSFANGGPATTVRVSLSRVATDGGPVEFRGDPIAVGAGGTVRATPVDAALSRVRVTVTRRGGGATTRVVRNRARPVARVRVTRLDVAGRRVTATVTVGRLRAPATLGVVLRALRGSRTLARRTIGGAAATRTLTWTLPARVTGAVRIAADARVVTGASAGAPTAGAATAHRARTVRLR